MLVGVNTRELQICFCFLLSPSEVGYASAENERGPGASTRSSGLSLFYSAFLAAHLDSGLCHSLYSASFRCSLVSVRLTERGGRFRRCYRGWLGEQLR